ncbi:response regulator [Rhizohabitans arisaemae]|uniref:response regulator n=1 Tax=Rhizohabitans arisaemae TaxID=2720610 RepID=UPI0024B1A9EB|nr:response regulator transcription factor [Rhizohabitans arisaemae]
MGESTYTVLVADDQPLLRAAFRLLIDSTPDLKVVGEAGTGRETIELAARLRPDLVLMDVRMPDLDGLEATRRIRADPSTAEVKIVVLTTFDVDEYVYAALRAGAAGFLLKNTHPADLLGALRVVAGGEALLAPSVTKRLIEEFARRFAGDPGAPGADLSQVTDRQRQVLLLIARGLTNPEIAERLGVSIATVKTHIRGLLAKLDAHDRAQLVIAAYESGLVRPDPASPPHP